MIKNLRNPTVCFFEKGGGHLLNRSKVENQNLTQVRLILKTSQVFFRKEAMNLEMPMAFEMKEMLINYFMYNNYSF
jgi:hypothetical protein